MSSRRLAQPSPPRSGTSATHRRSIGSASPGAKDKAKCGAASPSRALPRQVAPRGGGWDPDAGTLALTPGQSAGQVGDIVGLVAALSRGGGARAGEDLCVALRGGGHAMAENACELAAIQAVVSQLLGSGSTAAPRLATEALWYLIDDYDSCQSFIMADGHSKLFLLAREAGSQDATITSNTFRLLAETLYGERRGAHVWGTADLDFIVDALDWALRADMCERELSQEMGGGTVLGTICDVAALWVQRSTGSGTETVKALVGIIPSLLEKMAQRSDDPNLLQHGCRLLYALARTCNGWPEDMRQPALAALGQLASILQVMPHPELAAFSALAYRAVHDMEQVLEVSPLASMD